MFSWGTNEKNLTLGQQATKNIAIFREKKKNYINECLDFLIRELKSEILYETSIGNNTIRFNIEKYEDKFPKLTLGTDLRPSYYNITAEDKVEILKELVEHFQDRERYPYLKSSKAIFQSFYQKYSLQINISEPEDAILEEIPSPELHVKE